MQIQMSESEKLFMENVEHFRTMKEDLGMSTIWDMHMGRGKQAADELIMEAGPHKMTYTYIESMGDSYDDVVWKTISATAASGSVKDLWKAADDLILASGTHHVYIEDFDVQKDGTLELVTGS